MKGRGCCVCVFWGDDVCVCVKGNISGVTATMWRIMALSDHHNGGEMNVDPVNPST